MFEQVRQCFNNSQARERVGPSLNATRRQDVHDVLAVAQLACPSMSAC